MKLYVVRNKEGKFFRSIGYGGSGANWVDGLDKAKFYTKIGQAKSRCTYFGGHYPQFGVPEVLEFDLNTITPVVINAENHVSKSIRSKKVSDARQIVRGREYELKRAHDWLDRATSPNERRRCQNEVNRAQERLAKADAEYQKIKGQP